MNKQNWATALAIGVIAIAGAWFLTKQKPEIIQTDDLTPQTNAEDTVTLPSQTKPAENKKTWEGILETSNNSQKGNLMLITKDHIIYLKTSRDFSSLINKNVEVTYQGSLDNFILGNISLK